MASPRRDQQPPLAPPLWVTPAFLTHPSHAPNTPVSRVSPSHRHITTLTQHITMLPTGHTSHHKCDAHNTSPADHCIRTPAATPLY